MALAPHSAHADGFTALASGTVIERYRIESVIAAGGFGITYLCRHATLNKPYALKEHFPRQFAYREGSTSQVRSTDSKTFSWALDRFLEEGRSLAKCAHPGVVSVTDVFEANNTAYMVLDYEEGLNFKDWLTALGRPPTQEEIDAIIEPLLDALEYVHAQGMLHRDIAPDNIVIRADGSPCLIDFGSARQAVAERSEMMSAIVKNGFSPLEQYSSSGKAQGPWSDIYALAATLYRAISGKTPNEATERQIDDELLPIAETVENPQAYRRNFLDGIDRALRLRPGERPQSVSQWRPVLSGTDDSPTPLHARVTVPQSGQQGASAEASRAATAQAVSATGTDGPRSSSVGIWIGAIVAALVIGAGGYAYRSTMLDQAPPRTGVTAIDAAKLSQDTVRQSAAREPGRTTSSGEQRQPPRIPGETVPSAAPIQTAPSGDTREVPTKASPAASTTIVARERASQAVPAPIEPAVGTAAVPATEPNAPTAQMRSIAELAATIPAFSPIDGLAESAWKQPCASCHKWTQESLCKQGQSYADAPDKINRHPHPFGGEFKTKLKSWAETGCK